MPLLNYTSKVPASDSIAQISKMLAKAGASAVMHEYDDSGNIKALSFKIKMPTARDTANSPIPEISFRLPSDWRPVKEILNRSKPAGGMKITVYRSEEHARDVSWRIIKDWVEAQLALIEVNMVTTAQLFLPYAVTRSGQTLYEQIASNPQMLLGSGE